MSRKVIAGFFLLTASINGLFFIWFTHLTGDFNAGDVYSIVFVTGITVVGSLILARQPGNRLGWLFGAIGTLWAISNTLLSYTGYALSDLSLPGAYIPWVALIGSWFSDLAWVTSATFLFLLFPDGQLPSPRWRVIAWFVSGIIAGGMTVNLIAPGPLSQFPSVDNPLGIIGAAALVDLVNQTEWIFILMVVVCLGSTSVRFRTAGSQIRSQIKWIAYYGLSLAILFVVQSLVAEAWSGTLLEVVTNALGEILFTSFPFFIGIAILRHRLFDIDLVIRRTLQYTLLTALLALVYFGSVTVLQGVFTALGGSQSPVITVISTLAIAALFNPLRRRLQDFIDRRFYRQKYDAEQALEVFAASARSETDIQTLTAQLVAAVQTSIQPERTSIWMRPAAISPSTSRAGQAAQTNISLQERSP